MDDDAERRGRPTVHVAFGEATAVLAGDALQALAFQVLAGSEALDPRGRAAAVAELAGAAGSRALVGGQFDDLAFAAGDGDAVERVLSVHARKTAALIAAGVGLGALAAGVDAASRGSLRSFGEEVGVAFQIADDLLDEGGDDPCSLVRVLGPGPARERAGQLLESALTRIDGLGARAEPLRELARYALRRDR
jgi:farnesyl diphosphate synthase